MVPVGVLLLVGNAFALRARSWRPGSALAHWPGASLLATNPGLIEMVRAWSSLNAPRPS